MRQQHYLSQRHAQGKPPDNPLALPRALPPGRGGSQRCPWTWEEGKFHLQDLLRHRHPASTDALLQKSTDTA